MHVLGIETSCDETAAAIVRDDGTVLANVVYSQIADHAPYGGVVPEIAARAHLDALNRVIDAAFAKAGASAGIAPADLDAVAATAGPGLIGGVMVGMMTGKALAAYLGKPFIGVNHLEGHALSPRLDPGVEFPYLLLLVSGGHTQILLAEGVGKYTRLGATIDDAAGECFDKSAKLLGLPQPGGPALEALANTAQNPARFALPRPLRGKPGNDLSFSGLKTAMRESIDRLSVDGEIARADAADLAAALQTAVAEHLADRVRRALAACTLQPVALVAAGGVAANGAVRAALQTVAKDAGLPFLAPPAAFCTDNGAMIAWAGIERLKRGDVDGLDLPARPRWPLDQKHATVNG
ncbi:MAG: tRNA (adenosine(37)-N6)-threonylcarbamoyltransferase complex transferase subunit TsaD [Rhodospirillales bacterium]|nr:tRNA (adenosine(37)-N6)-threonylcarbamoyltransferase complex transferase subunit TsaD [Alphaproteobacteria bacterium]MCB9986505.1 tRNA (adenosine(37)-N6)-threonylcarbamoyltransferase complex transferase subunit TsaD [Rhodospirillales bacterium]USO08610.1 MAG: tRNA (adenosine(37)-N6)-threonylcarbamoyltransferase complex transferase subunit TsaD [Rhodospirillales bacterium]